MTHNSNALVLEISKQDKSLSMSIFEQREVSSTIKHYSQCPVSFSEINKLCQEVISILNKVNKPAFLKSDLIQELKKTGQLLWDHLFTRAVKDRLRTTIIRDLILSLDEELINIPWELFYDGKDFLCLKFSLGRLVRTKGQINPPQYRSLSSVPKMLILANPTDDLKSAYLEGKYIKNQFDRRRSHIKIDFKSTNISTLYVKKNLRDYDIVHFAGHCEYDITNPQNTGWLLSDGRFSVQDILALGESPSLPNLVFSNTCHSAEVRGNLMDTDYQEKTYSLAAAFLFSGVRHYIGAIWKIEDPVSLNFAKEFYTHLLRGESMGECLRLARLRLIKEYGIGSILWASYLLYGDPNFSLFKQKSKALAPVLKRNLSAQRKTLAKLSLAAALICLFIYLFMWLPSRNPSNYFLSLKAQKLFLKGMNQEVIALAKGIIKNDPLFLEPYPLLANTYQRLGDRENALKYYFEYALQAQKRQDKRKVAAAYTGIAWTYHLSGDYSKSWDFYQKAISVSAENKDKLSEAAALEKLAVWYIDKEDYDKALELLTRAAEFNRERQNIPEYRYNLACDYFDIGLVFVNKDDYETAREFYQKSSSLFEKMKLRHELSDCYFNLGEIFLFEKQYQKALGYYLQGLAIDQAQGNLPNLASDYDMIGELYSQMGDFAKAQEFFNQALSVAQQIKAKPESASICYNLGLLYKQRKQVNKAREYLRQAQELYRQMDLPNYQRIKQELLELVQE